ncbi:hypothetical protein HDU84_004903 [Entophlyctis sp. JEL0112]|nr:hypothetical protein HDU84_004903 [Entophlyctis sp. JEL0112]
MAGVIEFVLEAFMWPSLKGVDYVTFAGVILALAFQFLRSLAMITAGANFTHLISFQKRSEHVLVTNGIYWCGQSQQRIQVEENLLMGFFPDQYEEYRKRTWVLIPGIP